jgi:hypothetical protein
MKYSLMTLGLAALCASGITSAGATWDQLQASRNNQAAQSASPTAADIKQAAQKFSVTITNNSNDEVYLAGFYNVKSTEPLVRQSVLAGSKNLVVTFDQKNDYYGHSVDLQKVTVRIGQSDWKTVTNHDSVVVEQKDVGQLKRPGK